MLVGMLKDGEGNEKINSLPTVQLFVLKHSFLYILKVQRQSSLMRHLICFF